MKKMEWKLNLDMDTDGTWLHGHIHARYSDIERLFGEPDEGDGCKVSGEWAFETDDGDVVTLYDWKSTSLYDPFLPTVERFRCSHREVEFNVGAHNRHIADKFITWLEKQLKSLNAIENKDNSFFSVDYIPTTSR